VYGGGEALIPPCWWRSLRDLGRLWYEQAPDAVDYAKFYSRSHDAAIRVYDQAGNVIENARAAGGQ
jgi:hypothetical protein